MTAGVEDDVRSLILQAQTALGVGKGRLVHSSGSILDASSTIKDTELQNGDSLTFQTRGIQIQRCGGAFAGAFAAILGDGSVQTWGDAAFGGNSSAVQAQLKDVLEIQASGAAFCSGPYDGIFGGAFAAILGDRSVVTWGLAVAGGDSSAVQHQLKDVQLVQGSERAFAALLADGSVVAWGHAQFGGDTSAGAGSAKTCPADPSLFVCFCCGSWRRIRRYVG